uniref:Lysosomal Pro-X carboxypeptidase n=1 Tax=Strombidium inclinatum TaxID=197538 RepID=A0A7S3ISV4_9SPIT|mmetsp:Transcript_35029/g.53776  ORF Transcript_35029/g.53776 Transcript_35029/m.53776 type:complete len:388 (+) Transcript_35029:428-1591(+)|eukprot:CAMPEP_0170490812 /NCGR_PEP_ID=MMETSP0208-20121228/9633_1 /TAXON_ID=197538 /ORGANISM="Strombidium inclinatum, Strain S3" /LENGTH=387 /DNA_ID=CAMNT_0010766269 /DNA_START=407 /DNA_END=1570 /DNA_ORIENTATION=+
MMDYVNLIKKVKADYNIEDDPSNPENNTPVIVFGGSYGGMLAAWLRMKHPSVFQGAIAASAPTCYFEGATTVTENSFSDQVTADFARTFEDKRCSLGIQEGNRYFVDFAADPTTFGPELKETFKTCDDITTKENITDLYTYLANGFAYMAMTDYPYNSSFLEPMPAWPVNASCQAFKDVAPPTAAEKAEKATVGAMTDRQALVMKAMFTASQVYFNSSGQITCNDYKQTDATGNLDGDGWNVLACNQVPMPIAFGSPDSMFNDEPFDKAAYTKDCQDKYGLTPDYGYVLRTYGGQNFKADYKQYTNIVFSNGELDPWMPGGAYSYINIDVPTYIIKNGAHHLDLREPAKGDEDTGVEYVRQQEMDLIEGWVRDFKGLDSSSKTSFTQ